MPAGYADQEPSGVMHHMPRQGNQVESQSLEPFPKPPGTQDEPLHNGSTVRACATGKLRLSSARSFGS